MSPDTANLEPPDSAPQAPLLFPALNHTSQPSLVSTSSAVLEGALESFSVDPESFSVGPEGADFLRLGPSGVNSEPHCPTEETKKKKEELRS